MSSEFLSFSLLGREFTIYFFGVFLFLGVILAIVVLYEELKRRSYETRRIFDNVFWIVLMGLVGARIGYVLLHLGFFRENPLEMVMFWKGGLVFSGGFVGGLLMAVLWLWVKNRQELWGWLDSAIVALTLGGVIGSVGEFISGVDYGKSTRMPWGVIFPVLGDNIPRHPTQIYEFIGLIFVFIILLYVSNIIVKQGNKAKHLFPGFIFFFGTILTFFVKFVIDFEVMSERIIFTISDVEISSLHISSLTIIILAIVGWIWKEMDHKKNQLTQKNG